MIDAALTDRHTAVRHAKTALTDHGKRWADARTWALTHGWMPADAHKCTINPAVVDAYVHALETS